MLTYIQPAETSWSLVRRSTIPYSTGTGVYNTIKHWDKTAKTKSTTVDCFSVLALYNTDQRQSIPYDGRRRL